MSLNTTSGNTEVLIDHLRFWPPEFASTFHQGVLQPLALPIVLHLTRRRLAKVHARATCQMLRGNFTHRRSPCGAPLRGLPATAPGLSRVPPGSASATEASDVPPLARKVLFGVRLVRLASPFSSRLGQSIQEDRHAFAKRCNSSSPFQDIRAVAAIRVSAATGCTIQPGTDRDAPSLRLTT